ncbi:hypothetical protein HPC49_02730 [Pyxidicoccus fallax]|uniref:Uncharacterized protein n=1 Tax=Pyxidicoccus fallax TaxID=394095 RepID=A0A848L3G8_9BACT|nr:hypothetical protein [Pyxidicoccus fallax]NMO13264.1 hypothetical protein [Pyxidicoccus fallax]NPC77170.1 hypothetical protein [Pyxidicoccus fallax]
MRWHQQESIPHYEDALEHPEWGFMLPTDDMDVFVFEPMPSENWKVSSFNYAGEKVFFRHRLHDDRIQVDVFIPSRPSDERTEGDDESSQYRCALWLCNLEQMKDGNRPPNASVKHSVFSDFEYSLAASRTDPVCFGFYHCEWY